MKPKQKSPAMVLVALMTMTLLGAAVHPEATLKSSVSTVQAGASMPLTGEEFVANQTVKLALRGALAEHELPDAKTDGDGKFSVGLQVPSDVRPGVYRLVALADDGDVVASLDLTVEAAAPAAIPHDAADHDMGAAGGTPDGGMAMEAWADALPIERSRTGMEWGAIGLLIGLSAGLGLHLLRAGESGGDSKRTRIVPAASAPDSTDDRVEISLNR